MKPRRLLNRLFHHKEAARQRPPKTDAEKARELEQIVQTGVALNKFPPR
jgi:hypothetical protein